MLFLKPLAPKTSLSTMKSSSKRLKLKRMLYQSRSHTPQRMGESMGSLFLPVPQHYSHFTCRSSTHIVLNESSYDMHPDIFSTLVAPNLGLIFSGVPDGIQACATYNPPGPTSPGDFSVVCIFPVYI